MALHKKLNATLTLESLDNPNERTSDIVSGATYSTRVVYTAYSYSTTPTQIAFPNSDGWSTWFSVVFWKDKHHLVTSQNFNILTACPIKVGIDTTDLMAGEKDTNTVIWSGTTMCGEFFHIPMDGTIPVPHLGPPENLCEACINALLLERLK